MAVWIPRLRAGVWGLALLPLAAIIVDITRSDLGPDPGQALTERLGLAALQCLIATLCMTPLARMSGWSGWVRVRRTLGLFAFFYVCLHLLAFLQFILGWSDLWVTFTQRPYIVLGALSFVVLALLAATSTKAMMRRLGRRWKLLHRLVYVAVLLAWGHYFWQARSDISAMVVYGSFIVLLLGMRVYWFGWRTLVPLKMPAR